MGSKIIEMPNGQKGFSSRKTLAEERFIKTEEFDKNGLLTKFEFNNIPRNFNFSYDVIDVLAKKIPDKPALLYYSDSCEKMFTFEEISKLSNQAANYFNDIGIKSGDKVLVEVRSNYQFWIIFAALHKVGAIMIPNSFLSSADDLVHKITTANVSHIIASDKAHVLEEFDRAFAHKGIAGMIKNKLLTNATNLDDGWESFDDNLVKYSDSFERIQTNVDDPMIIFFTSGTTNRPKMVVHTYSYPLAHIATAKYWQNVQPDEYNFIIADRAWAFSAGGGTYGQWLMESPNLIYDYERFDSAAVDKAWRLIEKNKVSAIAASTPIYSLLLKGLNDLLARGEEIDLSHLKNCAGAGQALPKQLLDEFYKKTGVKIRNALWQTETIPEFCIQASDKNIDTSIGTKLPFFDIEVLKENGEAAGVGELGEICIRHKNHTQIGLFKGYANNPEANAKIFDDEYYHTGDWAYKTNDGHWNFHGRMDSLIKASGYRIAPEEVEEALNTHPAIKDCRVYGEAMDNGDTQLVADVTIKKGVIWTSELEKEIKNYVAELTTAYKKPRKFNVCSEIPRTITGKIMRKAI
ncbi:MAG: AMP-binding protein [Clostridiales bacterium]|jgi:acetyl-CoA synthetase|nr:AMP-binding protein [Clostridiales bacterium]